MTRRKKKREDNREEPVKDMRLFRSKEREAIAIDLIRFVKDEIRTRDDMGTKINELSISHGKSRDTIEKVKQKLKEMRIIFYQKKKGYTFNENYEVELMQSWKNILRKVNESI